jgi:phage tail-like protein
MRRYRVKWDGILIPGISRVDPLQRQTEIVRHREGGDPSTDRLSPHRTSYSSIALERCKSQDLAFETGQIKSGVSTAVLERRSS